jgi:hypothetical protein
MARKKLEAKKPMYVHELPLNEWVSGELLEIVPGEVGKHSAKYKLKLSNGKVEKLYGCAFIDNAVDETHIGEILHFKYTGKEEIENGFRYLIEVEVGTDDFSADEIEELAQGQ